MSGEEFVEKGVATGERLVIEQEARVSPERRIDAIRAQGEELSLGSLGCAVASGPHLNTAHEECRVQTIPQVIGVGIKQTELTGWSCDEGRRSQSSRKEQRDRHAILLPRSRPQPLA